MYKTVMQIIFFVVMTTILSALFIHIGLNIFISILLSIILQYGGSGLYKNILEATTFKKIQQLEVEKLKQLSYQLVEVVCPCSKDAKQIVPIRLNTANQYKCNTCGKTISIYTSIETAISTEPINDTDLRTIEKLITDKLNESTSKH